MWTYERHCPSCTKDRVRRWRCRRTCGHCSSPDRGSGRFIIRLELARQPANLLSIVVHVWAPACGRRSKRSEEHTSELQSQSNIVCRLLLEKKTMRDLIVKFEFHFAANVRWWAQMVRTNDASQGSVSAAPGRTAGSSRTIVLHL